MMYGMELEVGLGMYDVWGGVRGGAGDVLMIVRVMLGL